MSRHAGFRWGGVVRQELTRGSGGHSGGSVRESGSVLRVCFVYSPFFCIVVPVPFVCCSVKLPLSVPTSFLPVSFHSPPHPGGGSGDHVVLLLPAAAKTRTMPKGGCDPVGSPCWSRLLADCVDLWRERKYRAGAGLLVGLVTPWGTHIGTVCS